LISRFNNTYGIIDQAHTFTLCFIFIGHLSERASEREGRIYAVYHRMKTQNCWRQYMSESVRPSAVSVRPSAESTSLKPSGPVFRGYYRRCQVLLWLYVVAGAASELGLGVWPRPHISGRGGGGDEAVTVFGPERLVARAAVFVAERVIGKAVGLSERLLVSCRAAAGHTRRQRGRLWRRRCRDGNATGGRRHCYRRRDRKVSAAFAPAAQSEPGV
jgi:hypothetical protein